MFLPGYQPEPQTPPTEQWKRDKAVFDRMVTMRPPTREERKKSKQAKHDFERMQEHVRILKERGASTEEMRKAMGVA